MRSVSDMKPVGNLPYQGSLDKLVKNTDHVLRRGQELFIQYELDHGKIPPAFRFHADRSMLRFEYVDGEKTFNDAIKEAGIVDGPLFARYKSETRLDAHSTLDPESGKLLASERDLQFIAGLRDYFEPLIASDGKDKAELGNMVEGKRSLFSNKYVKVAAGFGIAAALIGAIAYVSGVFSGSNGNHGGGNGPSCNNCDTITGDPSESGISQHAMGYTIHPAGHPNINGQEVHRDVSVFFTPEHGFNMTNFLDNWTFYEDPSYIAVRAQYGGGNNWYVIKDGIIEIR